MNSALLQTLAVDVEAEPYEIAYDTDAWARKSEMETKETQAIWRTYKNSACSATQAAAFSILQDRGEIPMLPWKAT